MEDGSYGSRKRIEGKLATVRMDPQPGEVICVHREYTKLARQLSYERRVTYVEVYFLSTLFPMEMPPSPRPMM